MVNNEQMKEIMQTAADMADGTYGAVKAFVSAVAGG